MPKKLIKQMPQKGKDEECAVFKGVKSIPNELYTICETNLLESLIYPVGK